MPDRILIRHCYAVVRYVVVQTGGLKKVRKIKLKIGALHYALGGLSADLILPENIY